MAPPASVLVADYVDHTASSWADALRRAGFVVHCCRPIDMRPALLQAYRPEVLILAVSRLRSPVSYSNLEGRRLPVIVVSADPGDRGRASQFGCAMILQRPARGAQLVDAVRRVLGIADDSPSWPVHPALHWIGKERLTSSTLRAQSRQLCDQALDLRRRAAELVASAKTYAYRGQHATVEDVSGWAE